MDTKKKTFLRKLRHAGIIFLAQFLVCLGVACASAQSQDQVGGEVAIPKHLQDGEEFEVGLRALIAYGQRLFDAKFTVQEGAGRPLSKGTGAPLSDPSSPLVFPRNFDRISSPEANACSGCHNVPFSGGGGDRVTEVFVLAQRFDHLTFDHNDGITLRGAVDESGKFVTMNDATNDRKTIGMNGSGFLEMVARQMTADLQAIADATPPTTITGVVVDQAKGKAIDAMVDSAKRDDKQGPNQPNQPVQPNPNQQPSVTPNNTPPPPRPTPPPPPPCALDKEKKC